MMTLETSEMAKKKEAEPVRPSVGGKREGAGRKAGEHGRKIQKEVYLTPAVLEFLTRDGWAAGVAIELMVRKSAAFKAWQKVLEQNR